MKKKANSKSRPKVADLQPRKANPKGGLFVAAGDVNGDNVVAGNLIGTDSTGVKRGSK